MSWLAIAVAGVAIFIFAALWYGLAFSKLYRRELGVPENAAEGEDSGPKPVFFLIQLLTALVLAFAISFFAGTEPTPGSGALVGLVAGVLVAAAQVQLYLAEGKSRTVLFLHVSYFLIALTLAGAIVGLIQ